MSIALIDLNVALTWRNLDIIFLHNIQSQCIDGLCVFSYTLSFFKRIYFIRISRLKCEKVYEYFKNNPGAEIDVFLLSYIKLSLSLSGKASHCYKLY